MTTCYEIFVFIFLVCNCHSQPENRQVKGKRVTCYLSKPPSLVHSGTAQIGERLGLNHSCLCVHCRCFCFTGWRWVSDPLGLYDQRWTRSPNIGLSGEKETALFLMYWPVPGTPCELCVSRRALVGQLPLGPQWMTLGKGGFLFSSLTYPRKREEGGHLQNESPTFLSHRWQSLQARGTQKAQENGTQ